MANNYFQFKQFKITQNNAAMKVGTDGVLLGAWTNCSNAKNILDIGTGTGLIALMLAQRSNATITGIDIDEGAIEDAVQNTETSPWTNRIEIKHTSLQDFALLAQNTFDLIVSNPPFFENSLKADTKSRTRARHTDSLKPKGLIENTAKLLSKSGTCCFIIPASSFDLYHEIATQYGLSLSNRLWLKPTPTKDPKRVLIEFSKTESEPNEDTIIVEEFGRHKYSEAFKNLTKDFYIKT